MIGMLGMILAGGGLPRSNHQPGQRWSSIVRRHPSDSSHWRAAQHILSADGRPTAAPYAL